MIDELCACFRSGECKIRHAEYNAYNSSYEMFLGGTFLVTAPKGIFTSKKIEGSPLEEKGVSDMISLIDGIDKAVKQADDHIEIDRFWVLTNAQNEKVRIDNSLFNARAVFTLLDGLQCGGVWTTGNFLYVTDYQNDVKVILCKLKERNTDE